MQRRLSIQNEDITIPQMTIHLLRYRRCPCVQPFAHQGVPTAFLWCEQLVGDGSSLFKSHLVLQEKSATVYVEYRDEESYQ